MTGIDFSAAQRVQVSVGGTVVLPLTVSATVITFAAPKFNPASTMVVVTNFDGQYSVSATDSSTRPVAHADPHPRERVSSRYGSIAKFATPFPNAMSRK